MSAGSDDKPASAAAERWRQALLAARLLAADPGGLGGVWLKARSGPARDQWLAALERGSSWPLRRLPAQPDADALTGALDPVASLAAGRAVRLPALVGVGGRILVAPSAERLGAMQAALLAQAFDAAEGDPARLDALVLLDEGVDEERVSAALADRVGLVVNLEGLDGAARASGAAPDEAETLRGLAQALSTAKLSDRRANELVALAAAMGVTGMRAPLLACRAARAAAALSGRAEVSDEDVAVAAALTLAPRRRLDAAPEEPAPPPPPAQAPDQGRGARRFGQGRRRG